MGEKKEMTLVGFYTFKSKEKDKDFYVVQCLVNTKTDDSNRGSIINIFTTEEIYAKIFQEFDIGSCLLVNVSINYDTAKAFYEIVL